MRTVAVGALRGAALTLGLVGLGCNAEAEHDREQLRADMREIYASIGVLLPLSVDEAEFRSPEHREEIRQALATLAARAEHVGSHGGRGDRRIRYLGGSLARESSEALRRFEAGRVEASQFFLRRLTDYCVACHSGLPSPKDSPLARDFVKDEALEKLPLEQRASLQVATRRFDDALASFEAVIASGRHPAELIDPLSQYLAVALRVKRDLTRPIPVLRALAAREGLWKNLRIDVERWAETLERHAAKPPGEFTLESARGLLDEAREVSRFPMDRQALVHHLLASAGLRRYVEAQGDETHRDVAEAYYWLGLIESRLEGITWVAEADFYLETAIRLAPGDPIAAEAFALFEEQALLAWSGSSGTHMPEDVRRHLEELRTLVESS